MLTERIRSRDSLGAGPGLKQCGQFSQRPSWASWRLPDGRGSLEGLGRGFPMHTPNAPNAADY